MGLTERALRELMRILETGKFPSDDSAASDLYFVVREALENRRTLSDRTAERDQLRILYNTARDGMREVGELLETCRIELAESRAEVERLRGSEAKAWEEFRALSVRGGAAVDAATARADAAEKELADVREALRSRHAAPLAGQTVADAVTTALANGDSHYTALSSTAAGLRRALEEVKCRCSRGIDNHCPECGDDLDRVVNNGPLNDDQFDAVKAGDWYCKKCKSDAAATGFKYWLDRQLAVVVYQTCDRCTALAASSDEHARRIKAEGLREVARAASVAPGAKHWEWDGLYNFIISEADRLEKEATDGR